MSWDQKWEEHKKAHPVGICLVCPTCRSGSASKCECAKKRWIESQGGSIQDGLTCIMCDHKDAPHNMFSMPEIPPPFRICVTCVAWFKEK
jgi:Ni,Fe-hydrogenase I small subunit